MTPLQLEILFWYHCRVGDYREGDFSAPAVREAIDGFRDRLGLLEAVPEGAQQWGTNSRTYQLTERARVFLQAIMEVPLPVQQWVMPENEAA